MNIVVQFKDYFWTNKDIFDDRYNNVIFSLERDYKNENQANQIKKEPLERHFIISEYYIRESLMRGVYICPPCVIGMDADGSLWRYEIMYSSDYGFIYLKKCEQWQYHEKMGSKKKGWRAIQMKEIKDFVDVVVRNWTIIPGIVYSTEAKKAREAKEN